MNAGAEKRESLAHGLVGARINADLDDWGLTRWQQFLVSLAILGWGAFMALLAYTAMVA